jgi:hypothetical protein
MVRPFEYGGATALSNTWHTGVEETPATRPFQFVVKSRHAAANLTTSVQLLVHVLPDAITNAGARAGPPVGFALAEVWLGALARNVTYIHGLGARLKPESGRHSHLPSGHRTLGNLAVSTSPAESPSSTSPGALVLTAALCE